MVQSGAACALPSRKAQGRPQFHCSRPYRPDLQPSSRCRAAFSLPVLPNPNGLGVIGQPVDPRRPQSLVDDRAHMRCDLLHRREPDVPALKNLLKEAMHHFPARKASGGEWVNDRHPGRAVPVGGLELLREGGKAPAPARGSASCSRDPSTGHIAASRRGPSARAVPPGGRHRIPTRGANSFAQERTSPSTPCLEAT